MLKTVNVIECTDGSNAEIVGLTSFPDTDEGNKDAEVLFEALIKETGVDPSDHDIEDAKENGIYEIGSGWIALVHSH